MQLITPDGVRHECAAAIKVWDAEAQRGSVEIYDAAGVSILRFWWIYDPDFTGYAVNDGDWSDPPKSEVEILREDIARLQADRDALTIAVLEGHVK